VIAAFVTDVDSGTSALAHVAQVVAIVVGAIWTYRRFIKQREDFPRATLEQITTHRELSSEHTYLRVAVKIDNVSAVLLQTDKVRTYVYQVRPVTNELAELLAEGRLVLEGEREASWPCVARFEGPAPGKIEPGEGDEFGFDFVIPTDVTTVFIYSYIKNVTAAGPEFGWTVTSLYDLDDDRGKQRARVESQPARTR
jgi:hypothetical protein